MKRILASPVQLGVMKTNAIYFYLLVITHIILFLTASFVITAQINNSKRDQQQGILSIAYFIESANNSIHAIDGLLKKDNYRNKITALNNPANSELGFNLKTEILAALEPILAKAKNTDNKKFSGIIDNLLGSPADNGLEPAKKYFPVVGLFSTLLSLVGNVVVREKNITQHDLDDFTVRVGQYFSKYEKLNNINEEFGKQLVELLQKSEDIMTDLKDFIIECVSTMNKDISKETLKTMSMELVVQQYYDPQKLQNRLDTMKQISIESLYPPDAATSIKMLTSSIKKLQKEFEAMYNANYKEMKELISTLKRSIPDLDQTQLAETNSQIDQLYNDSKQADVINLNINKLEERMNTACSMINSVRP